MQATFTLADEQFAANDYAGVMVGLPLTVQLETGPLLYGRDDGAGWFTRTSAGPASFKPLMLERVAFCGRISQIEGWSGHGDTLIQALVDCGVLLRMDLYDPQVEWAQPAAIPYGLTVGEWVVGVADLRGRLAVDASDLLWQPVQGAIVDIQLLQLNPAQPDFGTLRWLHGLPRHSFAPDQVFITIKVHKG